MSIFNFFYCIAVLYGYARILNFIVPNLYKQSKMVFGLFEKIKDLQEKIKNLIIKSFSLVLSTSVLIAVSSFLYIVIYHVTIPDIATTHPLNFLFESNCGNKRCAYPVALIDLQEGKFNFNFKRGEEYEIIVDLIAPETPVNHKVGMFVLNVAFESEKIVLKENSPSVVYEPEMITFRVDRKSTMMRYKSSLVKALFSLFYSPLLVTGIWEDSQVISTTVVSDYEVISEYPLLAIRVTLESNSLDIYEACLTVQAKLTGFRYYMYHYPVSSFMVGVPILFPLIILILYAKVYCGPFTKQKRLLANSFDKFKSQVSPKLETLEVESRDKASICEDVKSSALEAKPGLEIESTYSIDSRSSGNGSSLNTSSIDKGIEMESLSLSSISDELSFADDDDEGSIEVLGTPDTVSDLLRSKTPTDGEESGKSSIDDENEAK